MTNIGFKLYLLFTVSWFLHLPERIPLLGLFRFDFLLIIIITVLAISNKESQGSDRNKTHYLIIILLTYSILTIPFVEWPGSVIRNGIPGLVKGVVFFYFTTSFIKKEMDLKVFIFVFLTCQLWRVLEPLYLHITEGYWGSAAMMANWQYLDRLSGAPNDIVNPNGLAFVICTVLPFLYFLRELSWINWLAYVTLIPLAMYTLILTGSRSGIVGLFIIIIGILLKSHRRLLMSLSVMLIIFVSFPLLNSDNQDRILSIIGKGEKNAVTAEGRFTGMEEDLFVALRRPIFGHGLGTSAEANYHYKGRAQVSHNLYTEIAQELGLFGLLIFCLLIKSIFVNFSESKKHCCLQNSGRFLQQLINSMQVWLAMNFIFSFVSYGLSSYEWYLFAGFSVVIKRLCMVQSIAGNNLSLGIHPLK